MTEINSIYFLDLEQTIVSSFGDPVLCNVTRIKNFLSSRGATAVHIFSFAIYNDTDKKTFDREIKPMIETALELPVMTAPSVLDMIRADYKFTGERFDSDFAVIDYIRLRGKKIGFYNYVCDTYDFNTAVLIDDTMPDETVVNRKKGWRIEYWNVDSI